MKHQDVIAAIVEERAYQDSLPDDRVDGHVYTVGDEILLMQEYLQRAAMAWVGNLGSVPALEVVLKVAAIAIRCLVNHL